MIYKTLIILLFSTFGFSQQISISSTANLNLDSDASLNAFGLKISPSLSFDISDNTLTLSNTSTTVSNSNTSIDRVYNFSNTTNQYSGNLSITYEDLELNGAAESDLNIEIENSVWTQFTPSIVDETLNIVTYNSLSNTPLKSITAASSSVLNIDTNDILNLKTYPNPTENFINLSVNHSNYSIYIYDILGGKILETFETKKIDISNLETGTYFMKITNLNNNSTKTIKFLKK